ncbi:hypothetical protein [Flavobacterium saliperosum]
MKKGKKEEAESRKQKAEGREQEVGKKESCKIRVSTAESSVVQKIYF